MKVEQIYTGCLAHGAYYIVSDGKAAIIDPLREVKPYIERAEKDGAMIEYVFETHFHADFVSGHVDLAAKTGAKIVYGPTSMKLGFDAVIGVDGQEFELGKAKIRLIHTPGHTLESSIYMLIDENATETAIFTGDTLFIGDVGRPDLAQKVESDLTQKLLASHLYDSIRNKILPLPDHLIVYPTHGAGSACGKNMSKETSDLLGNQKKTNYALAPSLSREDFIAQVLDGLVSPPAYFPQNVMMNISGYESFDRVLDQGTRALSLIEFEIMANETDVVLLDTRKVDDFAQEFIPNSINIGIDGNFAVWVGTLIPDLRQNILLIIDPGREEEVVTRLARVGYDRALGYLSGGIAAWKAAGRKVDTIESVTVEEANRLKNSQINLLDVRKNSEHLSEHVLDTVNLPLDFVNQEMTEVDKSKPYLVYCAGGYRSMMFISILKARGYNNLINIKGGFKAIKDSGKFRVSDYVCPTTLL